MAKSPFDPQKGGNRDRQAVAAEAVGAGDSISPPDDGRSITLVTLCFKWTSENIFLGRRVLTDLEGGGMPEMAAAEKDAVEGVGRLFAAGVHNVRTAGFVDHFTEAGQSPPLENAEGDVKEIVSGGRITRFSGEETLDRRWKRL